MTGTIQAPVGQPVATRVNWWRDDASEAVWRTVALVGVLLALFIIGGVSRRSSCSRGADVVTRRARVAIMVGPTCGGRPAISSNSVAPSE